MLNYLKNGNIKKMTQKGLAPILIVLLIALGIGGYLIYTNYSNNFTKPAKYVQITPTPTESTSIAETANWKTYTNNEYKFSLKYPPEYAVKGEGKIIDLLEEDACCDSGFQIWLDESRFENSQSLIRCDRAKEEIKLNPAFPRSDCLEDGKRYGQNADIVSIKLANVEAISFYVADTGVGHLDHIIQTKKEPRIQIRYPTGNVKSIYDQILPTFKFTQ